MLLLEVSVSKIMSVKVNIKSLRHSSKKSDMQDYRKMNRADELKPWFVNTYEFTCKVLLGKVGLVHRLTAFTQHPSLPAYLRNFYCCTFFPHFDRWSTKMWAHFTLICFYSPSGPDKIPHGHYWSIVVVIVGVCSCSMQPSVNGSDRMGHHLIRALSKQQGQSISALPSSITMTYVDFSLRLWDLYTSPYLTFRLISSVSISAPVSNFMTLAF